MYKKSILSFSVLLLILIFTAPLYANHPGHDEEHSGHSHTGSHVDEEDLTPKASDVFNFRPGEVITYKIKKFGVSVGESQLIYEGKRDFEGVSYTALMLKTKVINFRGEERIYLDKNSLLPVVVERNIIFFGKKERIIERYTAKEGKVDITKRTKKDVTTQTIKKDTPLDNIQAFIFRTRINGFDEKKIESQIHLPMSEVTLTFAGEEILNISDKKYHTHLLEGAPRNLKVWFDVEKHHVPLRIDGKFGIGKVSLVLSDYYSS